MPLTDRTLVLDLDSCLINSFFDRDSVDDERNAVDPHGALKAVISNTKNQDMRRRFYKLRTRGMKCDFCGMRREHLDRFLSFAFGYFKYVIVWSAGGREYVHAIVNEIFKRHHRPHYILTRDDIVYENEHENDYYKPLHVINKLYPGVAPHSKTVFVDDKEDNFREDPGNGFTIPQCNIFVKDGEICAGEDSSLLCLMNWLSRENVINAQDITYLDKSCAFSCTDSRPLNLRVHDNLHVFFYAPITHV